MTLNGKEIHFKATIGALIEIAEICPDGDVNRVGELVGEMNAKTLRSSVKLISLLSNGTITEQELLDCDVQELQILLDAAFTAFREGQRGTVEVIPKKDEATEAEA